MQALSTIEQQGYLVLKQVFAKDICELLSNYARMKATCRPNIRRKRDPLADVHREYGDPLMEVLLAQLTPIMEAALGLTLWPTLSFYYTYHTGNKLAPHTDRSSCQFVAGLCIGEDPAFLKKKGGWPLIISHHGQVTPVSLQPGDIMIFKGHETQHWREPFEGEWFVSAIFGYVDQAGPFAFQKFDQRRALGMPHVGMFHWSLGCLKQKLKQWVDKR